MVEYAWAIPLLPALAFALVLLFGATGGPAVGDDLSDRFKNDFGDEPPVLPVPPAANPDLNVPPAANPDIKVPPAPNPALPIVPMPRLRPSHDIGPAAALPAALASLSNTQNFAGGGADRTELPVSYFGLNHSRDVGARHGASPRRITLLERLFS